MASPTASASGFTKDSPKTKNIRVLHKAKHPGHTPDRGNFYVRQFFDYTAEGYSHRRCLGMRL